MSGKESKGNFSYRYLFDAENQQQYAVYFDGERPVHYQAYNAKGKKVPLKPGKTIYAFDDQFELDKDNALLVTRAYQIKVGTGGSVNYMEMGVGYDMEVVRNKTKAPPANVVMKYTLNAASREMMNNVDGQGHAFDMAFPPMHQDHIGTDVKISAKGKITVPGNLMDTRAFPPHHATPRAEAARKAVAASPQPKELAIVRVSDDFSKASAKGTLPHKPRKTRGRDRQEEAPELSFEQIAAATAEKWPAIQRKHRIEQPLHQDDINYAAATTLRYLRHLGSLAQPDATLGVLEAAAVFALERGQKEKIYRHEMSVERQDINAAVEHFGGLMPGFLSLSPRGRIDLLEKKFGEIVDQSATGEILDMYKAIHMGMLKVPKAGRDKDKTHSELLLLGPSHVGKTETAKAIAFAKNGTDADGSLIRINMGEFTEAHSGAKLIGAPPGYVGHETSKSMVDHVRENPHCVLLPDEIEKAHPNAIMTFLGILDAGGTHDSHGRWVDFTGVDVVMTGNLGSKAAMMIMGRRNIGFGSNREKDVAFEDITDDMLRERQLKLDKSYRKDALDFFPPELFNRLEKGGGGMHIYQSFTPATTAKVLDLGISILNEGRQGRKEPGPEARALGEAMQSFKNVTIEISPEIRTQLIKDSYDPVLNAGKIQAVLGRKLFKPLGVWLYDQEGSGAPDGLTAFVATHGGARLVVDSLEGRMSPRIELPLPTPHAPANNNTVPQKSSVPAPGYKP